MSDQYENNASLFRSFYASLGRGQHREVFDIGEGVVFKVPLCAEGEQDNVTEASSLTDPSGVTGFPTSWCHLATLHNVSGLIMERVRVLTPTEALELSWHERWISRVDGMQVGYAVNGELVAFDWA